MMPQTTLITKKCQACESGTPPLASDQIAAFLPQVPDWKVESTGGGNELTRTFKFKNYHESMAFVNATAWISHCENHHPDIELHYNSVKIHYATHSIGGLSENDFICAAKINALLE
ncbi:MAG: 4a-hydroxytetrahydrobiopterin dehydratase [Phycisphaerales bacterium]|nr:4a-hydroxytetrahydrobiopterin dehydratase [Phycisphaerales bacterium]